MMLAEGAGPGQTRFTVLPGTQQCGYGDPTVLPSKPFRLYHPVRSLLRKRDERANFVSRTVLGRCNRSSVSRYTRTSPVGTAP